MPIHVLVKAESLINSTFGQNVASVWVKVLLNKKKCKKLRWSDNYELPNGSSKVLSQVYSDLFDRQVWVGPC